MRILVIIVAITALLGGWAHLVGGMAGLASGIVVLTLKLPPEALEASTMSQQKISFIQIKLLFYFYLKTVNPAC